jgi:hypothetical protein
VEADDTTEDLAFHLQAGADGAVPSKFWASGLAGTAPTGTTITQVFMSHADTAAAHTMTPMYMST